MLKIRLFGTGSMYEISLYMVAIFDYFWKEFTGETLARRGFEPVRRRVPRPRRQYRGVSEA